jgi:dTDP-4-dehydrorhamnose 3,5-epimerase-like enzyme
VESAYLLTLPKIGDSGKGYLSVMENCREIPFEVKRVFYVYDVPRGTRRGGHAHRRLKQVLWCPYGVIEIILDDGERKTAFLLDGPEKALVILRGFWREIHWRRADSVLCCLASEAYDENLYLRDYGEYLKAVEEGLWEDED